MSDSVAPIERALAGIAVGLANMEKYPRMFAVHPDALEALFVSLVAMREGLRGSDCDIQDEWTKFVRRVNGRSDSRPLWCILRDENMLGKRGEGFGELPRLLGDFGRWIDHAPPPVIA